MAPKMPVHKTVLYVNIEIETIENVLDVSLEI